MFRFTVKFYLYDKHSTDSVDVIAKSFDDAKQKFYELKIEHTQIVSILKMEKVDA